MLKVVATADEFALTHKKVFVNTFYASAKDFPFKPFYF